MPFTLIKLTGTYHAGGLPCSGQVILQLTVPMLDGSGLMCPIKQFVCPLDSLGRLSYRGNAWVSVEATDDPSTQPASATWTVIEQISGAVGARPAYQVVIPHSAAGGTVDLASLAPSPLPVVSFAAGGDLSGTYPNPQVSRVHEIVVTIDPAGGAAVIDLARGNVFHVLNPSAAATCTLTLTGATAGVSCGCTVFFHQLAAGNSQLAFAASGGTVVGMNDGTLPGPAQHASTVAVYSFTTTDGGVTWFGFKAGDSGVYVPPTVPGAPTIGAATGGNAQASVAFTPPASNGGAAITGYTATSTPGGLTGTGTSSPIVVTGLTNGTAYTFTVHATNSVGNSVESAASNSVTPATVPGAPTIGAATAGDTTGSIAFTPPASNGGSAITGYTATATPGGLTGTAASSPITITGLTDGTAYTATVHATNAVGNSAESAASNSFTPVAASARVSDTLITTSTTALAGRVATSGQTWVVDSGVANTTSTGLKRVSGLLVAHVNAGVTLDVSPLSCDYDGTGDGAMEGGLVFCYKDSANFCAVDFANGGSVYFIKYVAGVQSVISGPGGNFGAGAHNLKVTLVGSTFTAYVDGVSQFTGSATGIDVTGTQVGLYGGLLSTDTIITFKNILVP